MYAGAKAIFYALSCSATLRRMASRYGMASDDSFARRLIDVIVAAGIERNVSIKLTQLGIDVDRATCVDNLRRILDPAGRHDVFVRIDMENSSYTEVTMEVFETLWQQEYRNIGVALQ